MTPEAVWNNSTFSEKVIKPIPKEIIFFWEDKACASLSSFQTAGSREKPFKKPLCFAAATPALGTQVLTGIS